jgi:ubiquitin C-terminal hydrolase
MEALSLLGDSLQFGRLNSTRHNEPFSGAIVQIDGVDYPQKELVAHSSFFKQLLTGENQCFTPSFDCLGYFDNFMNIMISPGNGIEPADFSQHISYCYLAAFYGVRCLLSNLCESLTSMMRSERGNQESCAENILNTDLPAVKLGFAFDENAKKLGSIYTAAAGRLVKCINMITSFFRKYSTLDMDCAAVFAKQPNVLPPMNRTCEIFTREEADKYAVLRDDTEYFDVLMKISKSSSLAISPDYFIEHVSLCYLASFYGVPSLLKKFTDSMEAMMGSNSVNREIVAGGVLNVRVGLSDLGFQEEEESKWNMDTGLLHAADQRLKRCMRQMEVFVGDYCQSIIGMEGWNRICREWKDALTDLNLSQCQEKTIVIGERRYKGDVLGQRSIFFGEVLKSHGVEKDLKFSQLPFSGSPFFDEFLDLLGRDDTSFVPKYFSEQIGLCYLAAFDGFSELLGKLCKSLVSMMRSSPTEQELVARSVLVAFPQIPERKVDRLNNSEGSLAYLVRAEKRLSIFSRLMTHFFSKYFELKMNTAGVCADEFESHPGLFKVSVPEEGMMKYYGSDNMIHKFTIFLNFLHRLRVRVGEAVDFHVPLDMFCSLLKGQLAFIRSCYKIYVDEILDVFNARIVKQFSDRVDINGTPGIGKSVMGIYLLYRLVNEMNGPIVYCGAEWGSFAACPMRDESWKCIQYSRKDSQLIAQLDRQAYIILDGRIEPHLRPNLPTGLNGQGTYGELVVIGSPKTHESVVMREGVSEVRECYLPLWERAEFTALLSTCFGWSADPDFRNVGGAKWWLKRIGCDDTMIKRTEIFDLLPRAVCSKPLEGLIGLEKALTISNIQDLFTTMCETKVDVNDACHRLVYLERDTDEWGFVVPRIASDFIRCQIQYVLSSLGIEYHRDMARKAYAHKEPISYGLRYEEFSQAVLAEMPTNSFEIRQWFPNGKKTSLVNRIVFSQSMIKGVTHFLTGSFSDLVMAIDRYYAPPPGNQFPLIDSCKITKYTLVSTVDGKEVAEERTGMVGFQMTVGITHDITAGEVYRHFVQKGKGMAKPLIIFTVPGEVFYDFSPSLPSTDNGTNSLDDIDIFVMKLPLDLRLPPLAVRTAGTVSPEERRGYESTISDAPHRVDPSGSDPAHMSRELPVGELGPNLPAMAQNKISSCLNTSRSPEYHVGLVNQGSTCYLNSVLQSLFHIPGFRRIIYDVDTSQSGRTDMYLNLQWLFARLQTSKTPVRTEALTKSLGWNSNEHTEQGDVHEFCRFLLGKIEDGLKPVRQDNRIADLFRGKSKILVECCDGYFTSQDECFYDLSMDVEGCQNLGESFSKYKKRESLVGDDQYVSPDGSRDAERWTEFIRFPKVLHIHLRRFEYDGTTGRLRKIHSAFGFPHEIDLEPVLSSKSEDKGSTLYELCGVLVHQGDGHVGHYFAYLRTGTEKKWYKFNDSEVQSVNPGIVVGGTTGGDETCPSAYMLVYVQKNQIEGLFAPVQESEIPGHVKRMLPPATLWN